MDEQNQNAPAEDSAGSKKKMYIAIAIIIVVLIAIFIFGGKRTIAPGVTVDEKLNGEVKVTTEDGSVVVGGNTLPAGWPNDVASYPNGIIEYSGSSNLENGSQGMSVGFTTNDSVQAVLNFYNDNFSKNGWVVTQMANGDAAVISGIKGERNVTAYIGKGEDGKTSIIVGISSN